MCSSPFSCHWKFKFCCSSSIIHRPNVHYYCSLLSSNHTKHVNIPNFFALYATRCFFLHQDIQCVKSFYFSFLQTQNTVSARFMLKSIQCVCNIRYRFEWMSNVNMSSVEVSRDAYDFNILCICWVLLFEWWIDIDNTHWYHKCVCENIPFMVVNEIIFKRINFYCVQNSD